MKTIKKKANEASNSLKVKKVGATQHLKSGRKKRKNDIFHRVIVPQKVRQ